MAFSLFNSSKDDKGEESSFWVELSTAKQLDELINSPEQEFQLIFKHSTRCIISRTVLRNFERDWKSESEGIDLFLLDLLSHRGISSDIAERFGVEHQSPQLIVLKEGKVLMHRSHNGIEAEEVASLCCKS